MLFDEDDNKYFIDDVTELYRAYYYYYDIWENWNHFKILPEGKGTNHELPWLLNFLKYFDSIFKSIEYYQQKRGAWRNG